MNAHTQIVVCPERILEGLAGEMKFISKTAIYPSVQSKLETLEALYKSHMYIRGTFGTEKNAVTGGDEFFFSGTICGAKHKVRVY